MPLDRRSFLRVGAGASLGALAVPRSIRADSWSVGVGRRANAYEATQRAISACGEWPLLDLAGRTVVVKPNLVAAQPAASGATTDPEVVRAVVDLALAGGAVEVLVVEASPTGAHFEECGYGFFRSYDPLDRVQLVDLQTLPLALAPLPGALAYPSMQLPELVLRDDIVFVSAGKLKVHMETYVTLTTKNLFGLPGVDRYVSSPPTGRFAMHDRGVSQTIVDLNRLRPVHFAVVDGIWGMEGAGPLLGTPVQMNTVLAGRNPVAVDRVAMTAMGMQPSAARHLAYASRFGLGPADVGEVTVAGDPLAIRPFALDALAPILEYPRVFPAAFRPAAGQQTSALLWYAERTVRTLEIVRVDDESPAMDLVRTLAPYDFRDPGYEWIAWDGRDGDGALVPPGRYTVHVRAYSTKTRVRHTDCVGWVTVVA